MWEPSDWIALGALIVATVSSAAAIVSVAYTWWDRRESRPDPFRAAAYAEQVRIASDLVAVVRRAHMQVVDLASTDEDFYSSNDEVMEFIASTPHLPARMADATATWLKASAAAMTADVDWYERMADAAERREEAPNEAPNRRKAMDAAWDAFMGRIRHELGVGQLHDQVRDVIGVSAIEQQASERAARLRRLDMAADVYERRLRRVRHRE
jgi:hypothetical protein